MVAVRTMADDEKKVLVAIRDRIALYGFTASYQDPYNHQCGCFLFHNAEVVKLKDDYDPWIDYEDIPPPQALTVELAKLTRHTVCHPLYLYTGHNLRKQGITTSEAALEVVDRAIARCEGATT